MGGRAGGRAGGRVGGRAPAISILAADSLRHTRTQGTGDTLLHQDGLPMPQEGETLGPINLECRYGVDGQPLLNLHDVGGAVPIKPQPQQLLFARTSH